jgi:putative membrane protein insertion efficiency factor
MTENKWFLFVRNVFVKILIVPVKIYQYTISPVLPMSCRHVPSCSQYAIEALKIHGVFKGSYLALHRILRCHPWGTEGYDPVPPVFKIKKPESP